MAFPKAIESNSSDYQGTMQAEPFEITPPGVLVTSRIIRNDQSWGIKVDWEMHGNVVEFLDAEFRVRVLLESMGPGTEYDLPSAGPVIVGTLSVTPTYPGGVPTRTYTANINLAPGIVEVGTYLSDKAYLGGEVRIEANPSRGENTYGVRFEYQLTPRLSFQTEYGDARSGSADLIWSREY